MKISIGKSRKDIHWKVVDMTWEELCKKLSATVRTRETIVEYNAMGKDDKSACKDVGGFVGGVIEGGRRVRTAVTSRSLVTLDADYASTKMWDDVTAMNEYAMCCYSTHSHRPNTPRLRFVIPLDRTVSPEEYEPIARKIAHDFGINQFDPTTYDASRLMYWPSTSKDGEFIFEVQKGDLISADEVLATYHDWHNTAEWPVGSEETQVRIKGAKSQGEPTSKPGMVGLFCKSYDVPAAIETFLGDVYSPCAEPNRYTYVNGSTAGGAVLYQDGKFIYSHHSTDPACGQLCNAFDLVRLHKFGDLDAEADADCPVTKLPSYKAMCDYAQNDSVVKQNIIADNLAQAQEAFAEEVQELNWADKLRLNKNGAVESTINNVVIIMENDPNLAGAFAINAFTNRPCIVKNIPWKKCYDAANGSQWTDVDDSGLRHYIETTYGISGSDKISDARNTVMARHSFHPVRKYLTGLQWDGVKRGEKLFIHYLGAEDNEYTRAVTRKWLTAAVARIMRPGVKFDNLVVLVGAQGIGKSLLGKKLGVEWFSDTFTTVQGKDSYEQLKGSWIIEIGELSAMKKAEVESVKMFISKQEDNYRAAYGKFSEVNKRQCVFYGTTNDDSFLRDRTGNRRFWPIGCDTERALYEVTDLSDEDVNQIWAEAVHWYNQGEELYLNADLTKLAAKEQDKYMTVDPRQGMVEDYLDKPLPKNWNDMDKTQRRNYIQGYLSVDESELSGPRDSVNVVELAYELFGKEVLQPWEAKEFHSILIGIPGWKKSGSRKRSVYGQQVVYERGK